MESRRYYRIVLGRDHVFVEECRKGGFIGVDFDMNIDLTHELTENWRAFNKKFIPEYLEGHPGKKRISAGLACGTLWTLGRGIAQGDRVIAPTGRGTYYVGEVTGAYVYRPSADLPHQRPVRWFDVEIARDLLSDGLRNSTGSIGTLSEISKHSTELDQLIGEGSEPLLRTNDETIQDPSIFALELHLEDFLVANWSQTDLGKRYDIYEDENGSGKQYRTDTGRIDILAISKDRKEWLVVELKKGRTGDAVVGQVQRYMGFVLDELVENGQRVSGVIIALDDDKGIKRALRVAPNITFYRYHVRFDLFKQ